MGIDTGSLLMGIAMGGFGVLLMFRTDLRYARRYRPMHLKFKRRKWWLT